MKAAALQCELGICEGMDLVFYSGFRDFAFRDKVANLYLEVEAVIGLERESRGSKWALGSR